MTENNSSHDPRYEDGFKAGPKFRLQRYDDLNLANIPNYKYHELHKRKRRIHLLVLKSASEETSQIDCELIEADYGNSFHIPTMPVVESNLKDEEFQREDLGSKKKPPMKEEQKLEEEAKHVLKRQIEYEALSRIEQNGGVFKRKVDSVCIDQENHGERNHQVQMMSRIYTRAPKVHVAINFIKKEKALMILMQRPWFSRRWMIQEITLGRTATIHCGPATIDWNDFAVAVELFVEVENATHRLSEVMQKDEKFRHIPGWFEHVFRTQRMGTEARQLLNNPTNPLEVTNIRATKELSDKVAKKVAKGPHTIDPLERRSLLSLQYLVATMVIFQTSEPRDVIYSLLAVARDASASAKDSILSDPINALLMRIGFSSFLEAKPFEVDYGRAYSDVCRDFIKFSIERAYEVDPVQALDILCRPWALEPPTGMSTRLKIATDMNTEKQPISGVNGGADRYFEDSDKSWKTSGRFKLRKLNRTRSYKADIYNDEIANKLREIKEKHFPKRGLDNKPPEEDDIPRPSWVVSAKSAPFDMYHHAGSVEKTGRINADSLVGPPQDGHRNYSAAQAHHMNIKDVKFRKRLWHNHYSLYVKGFLFDEVKEVRDASQHGFIPASWVDLGGWKKPEKNYPPDSFWRTLVADRGKDNRNPPYYFARACRESALKGGLRSGGINTKLLIDNERNSIIAEFCRRVQAVIWNRRLFTTKTKTLGLGPSNVQEGDKVGIIYGCTVPVILRETTKEGEQKIYEEFEDSLEALKTCIKRSHEHRERRLKFRKEGTKLDSESRKALKIYNKKARQKHEGDKGGLWNLLLLLLMLLGFLFYLIKKILRTITWKTRGKRDVAKMIKNQAEADEKDPYRYYELIGDCYIHGMMDGEALRQKFYEDIPDQTFGLR
ncbi:heterokaryon incompatibility protein-domain-containing protein [Nemania sp. FL0031]|nr:heterokaryon incompatibility protein-domain-containing protein [Nemania sp. FL0031]